MHEHIIHSADDCPPPGGYCRTHELNLLLLAALYAVSRVLSRSLDFNESLRDVLRVLHDEAGLTRGLISVVDPDSGKLNIRCPDCGNVSFVDNHEKVGDYLNPSVVCPHAGCGFHTQPTELQGYRYASNVDGE